MPSQQTSADVEKFFADIHESLVVLTFRYFAVKRKDENLLLSAELQLGTSPAVGSISDTRTETDQIIAGQYQKLCQPGEAIKAARRLCESGSIFLGREKFSLSVEMGQSLCVNFNPQPRISPEGFGHPELFLSGSSRHQLVLRTDLLDSELKSAEEPFENVAELLGHIGLEPRLPDSVSVRIRTTAIARISEDPKQSKIENEKAYLRVRVAPNVEVRDIRIGWRCFADGNFHRRGSMPGNDIGWRSERLKLGPETWGVLQLDVPPRASLQLFLSYKNRLQHEFWLHDADPRGNVRWCVHKTLEKKTGWLLRELSQKGGKGFEEAVACLFNLLGFHTVHYGNGVPDGVDVVATTSCGDIVLIECTTDSIRNDKYQKLLDRLDRVKNALGEEKLDGIRTLALMVVRQDRASAKNSLDRGHELGVVTIVEEDLMDMFQQSRGHADAHRIVFEKLIDRMDDFSRPAGNLGFFTTPI